MKTATGPFTVIASNPFWRTSLTLIDGTFRDNPRRDPEFFESVEEAEQAAIHAAHLCDTDTSIEVLGWTAPDDLGICSPVNHPVCHGSQPVEA